MGEEIVKSSCNFSASEVQRINKAYHWEERSSPSSTSIDFPALWNILST